VAEKLKTPHGVLLLCPDSGRDRRSARNLLALKRDWDLVDFVLSRCRICYEESL
jgi:hypothetical protein